MSEPLHVADVDDGGDGDWWWPVRAQCAPTDPEALFPEKGGSIGGAKGVCVGCEVKAECLEYALASDERFGIWGGLSQRGPRHLTEGPLE